MVLAPGVDLLHGLVLGPPEDLARVLAEAVQLQRGVADLDPLRDTRRVAHHTSHYFSVITEPCNLYAELTFGYCLEN